MHACILTFIYFLNWDLYHVYNVGNILLHNKGLLRVLKLKKHCLLSFKFSWQIAALSSWQWQNHHFMQVFENKLIDWQFEIATGQWQISLLFTQFCNSFWSLRTTLCKKTLSEFSLYIPRWCFTPFLFVLRLQCNLPHCNMEGF